MRYNFCVTFIFWKYRSISKLNNDCIGKLMNKPVATYSKLFCMRKITFVLYNERFLKKVRINEGSNY